MGVHEAADGVLTRLEADRLCAYAVQLARELPAIAAGDGGKTIWAWAGEVQYVLEQVARG